MKTYKTIFHQLLQEIIKVRSENVLNNAVYDLLKKLEEKAEELEKQVSDE